MRNLEIKTRVAALAPIRARLRTLKGAARERTMRQTDWYVRVPRGRLKLREIAGDAARSAELIFYHRPDRSRARTSSFVRLPVRECPETRNLLARMFGLAVCVRKQREVWLFKNARIHLDRVADLGTFVEIEVVVTKGQRQAQNVMRELLPALGIRTDELIGPSYSDLLLARNPRT